MRTVRDLLAESGGPAAALARGNLMVAFAAVAEEFAGRVADELEAMWRGASRTKVVSTGQLSGRCTVAHAERRQDVTVDWAVTPGEYEVAVRVQFNGPGERWERRFAVPGNKSTAEQVAEGVVAEMAARDVEGVRA
jgi:hypothetical protein